MATQTELMKERQLLLVMELRPVNVWPPKCRWYNPDGSVNGILPCDPYSRLLYMGRGLRPNVALPTNNAQGTPVPEEYPVRKRASVPLEVIIPPPKRNATVTLVDAVVGMMQGRDTWEDTASELLAMLDGTVQDLPVDATRLINALNTLASQPAGERCGCATTQERDIRLLNRRYSP